MSYHLHLATSALILLEVSSVPGAAALCHNGGVFVCQHLCNSPRHNGRVFVNCIGVGMQSPQYSSLGWQGIRGKPCGLGPQEVSRTPMQLVPVQVYAAAQRRRVETGQAHQDLM